MTILRPLFIAALSAMVLPQAMACFTVYNTANQVVYSGAEPPIDMSYQIHQRLPAVFPGGHMVFGLDRDCPSIDLRRQASARYVTVSAGGQAMRTPRPDRQ
ncbi:MAG: hypothetical protein EON92_14085 [Burkholderiales bacterium]|nr:MAG: hypothetical protein EON92_14085 [Burkholderiales bacterium]